MTQNFSKTPNIYTAVPTKRQSCIERLVAWWTGWVRVGFVSPDGQYINRKWITQ